jgi:hypothetical protein
MAKPYSILAAALVASGHSLSTVTVVAPIDCRTLRPVDPSEDWFADKGRIGAFAFEPRFAMDPLEERAPANAAALSK